VGAIHRAKIGVAGVLGTRSNSSRSLISLLTRKVGTEVKKTHSSRPPAREPILGGTQSPPPAPSPASGVRTPTWWLGLFLSPAPARNLHRRRRSPTAQLLARLILSSRREERPELEQIRRRRTESVPGRRWIPPRRRRIRVVASCPWRRCRRTAAAARRRGGEGGPGAGRWISLCAVASARNRRWTSLRSVAFVRGRSWSSLRVWSGVELPPRREVELPPRRRLRVRSEVELPPRITVSRDLQEHH
jgi:hypothetical protein